MFYRHNPKIKSITEIDQWDRHQVAWWSRKVLLPRGDFILWVRGMIKGERWGEEQNQSKRFAQDVIFQPMDVYAVATSKCFNHYTIRLQYKLIF